MTTDSRTRALNFHTRADLVKLAFRGCNCGPWAAAQPHHERARGCVCSCIPETERRELSRVQFSASIAQARYRIDRCLGFRVAR